MHFSHLLANALAAAAVVSASPYKRQLAFPDPVPVTGDNRDCHDPSIVKRQADGRWFRFCTNNNIRIDSAPEITGPWKIEGAVLPPEGSVIRNLVPNQGPNNYWAPDVTFIDGVYYLYYSVSEFGFKDSEIGVATSDDMMPGTWVDHGSLGIPKGEPYNLIDPNFFRESPTSPIIFNFGSAWRCVFQTGLDGSFKKWNGAPTQNLLYNTTTSITEGAYEFWWEVDGKKWYYQFFSNGACCNEPPEVPLAPPGDEYKIFVCRSDRAEGPFFDDIGRDCLNGDGGKLLLMSHGRIYAPGGQSVYMDSTLRSPVVNYHYGRSPASKLIPSQSANCDTQLILLSQTHTNTPICSGVSTTWTSDRAGQCW